LAYRISLLQLQPITVAEFKIQFENLHKIELRFSVTTSLHTKKGNLNRVFFLD